MADFIDLAMMKSAMFISQYSDVVRKALSSDCYDLNRQASSYARSKTLGFSSDGKRKQGDANK